MSWASSEAVGVFMFLMPGFLAGTIFYSLTSYPAPSAFDRIMHALIFTTVGQSLVALAALLFRSGDAVGESFGQSDSSDFVLRVLLTVGLAPVWAYFLNNDVFHRFFRKIGLTKETSYPFELYSTFSQHHDCYVVLHLNEQRRLYGWPEEWPSHPSRGHFRILDAEWLTEDGSIPIPGVSAVLIPANRVEMVEFLKMETNKKPKE